MEPASGKIGEKASVFQYFAEIKQPYAMAGPFVFPCRVP